MGQGRVGWSNAGLGPSFCTQAGPVDKSLHDTGVGVRIFPPGNPSPPPKRFMGRTTVKVSKYSPQEISSPIIRAISYILIGYPLQGAPCSKCRVPSGKGAVSASLSLAGFYSKISVDTMLWRQIYSMKLSTEQKKHVSEVGTHVCEVETM